MKAWTAESFPKNKPLYIRRKILGGPGASASLVLAFCNAGVLVMSGGVNPKPTWITWTDLFMTCEQCDGKPCGRHF